MKKQLLTLMALIISINMYAQDAKQNIVINGCIVSMKESNQNDLTYENDSIKFSFTPDEYAWHTKITNNLGKDITVIWDKSTFILNDLSSKVIFANTLKMNIDNMIPNQDIVAGSFIQKHIAPAGIFTKRYAEPTINRKQIKKDFEATGKPHTAKIRLAFLIDGHEKKYDFNFTMKPAKKK